MGGGAVPRIPVVKAVVTRNAKRKDGTMLETNVAMLAEWTAVRETALNDTPSIVLARIAVTLACPVIMPPDWRAGFRPVVCRAPDLDRPECQVTSQSYRRFCFPLIDRVNLP
jgi:hypothetical protein